MTRRLKAGGPFFRFFRLIYLRLFRINDAPERIAAGIGLGVFFGVMPGMGPLIALFFAVIFRVNRAAAFLGGLLTNTWISVPILLVAARVGSALTGARYEYIQEQWHLLLKDFSFAALFKVSVDKILIPILAGYVIISLAMAVLTYVIALMVLKYRRNIKTVKILLVAVAFIFVSGVCYCDNGTDTREIRTARGIVTSRDWIKSIIVVNYIRFFVPSDIKIYKGNSTIGFTALNKSDPVVVKYYMDSSGAYRAVEITVEYSGDFPI